jgi:hypothetical protein
LHHILSAQFEIFPLLRAKNLPVILSELMNVVTNEEINANFKIILQEYSLSRPDAITNVNFELNRMFLLEILLIFIDVCFI